MAKKLSKSELEDLVAKSRKNVRYMDKSGQVNTVHHMFLKKFEAELAALDKPARKEDKELDNG